MDESRRRIVKFLEKEIKTYMALSYFFRRRASRNMRAWRERKSSFVPGSTKRE